MPQGALRQNSISGSHEPNKIRGGHLSSLRKLAAISLARSLKSLRSRREHPFGFGRPGEAALVPCFSHVRCPIPAVRSSVLVRRTNTVLVQYGWNGWRRCSARFQMLLRRVPNGSIESMYLKKETAIRVCGPANASSEITSELL